MLPRPGSASSIDPAAAGCQVGADVDGTNCDLGELEQVKEIGRYNGKVTGRMQCVTTGNQLSCMGSNISQSVPISDAALAAAAATATRDATVKVLLGPDVGDLTGRHARASASARANASIAALPEDSDDHSPTSCCVLPCFTTLRENRTKARKDRISLKPCHSSGVQVSGLARQLGNDTEPELGGSNGAAHAVSTSASLNFSSAVSECSQENGERSLHQKTAKEVPGNTEDNLHITGGGYSIGRGCAAEASLTTSTTSLGVPQLLQLPQSPFPLTLQVASPQGQTHTGLWFFHQEHKPLPFAFTSAVLFQVCSLKITLTHHTLCSTLSQ